MKKKKYCQIHDLANYKTQTKMNKKTKPEFHWSVSVQYAHRHIEICLYLLAVFACHLEYPVKEHKGTSPCRKEKVEVDIPKSCRRNSLFSGGAVTCTQHDLRLPGIYRWGKSRPLWGRLLARASHLFLSRWTDVMNTVLTLGFQSKSS